LMNPLTTAFSAGWSEDGLINFDKF
jgi:hypothetical protein